jgi:DnaJ-class molecular chaperone
MIKDDDMNEENFITKQCPNCSGYGSKGKPPYRVVCPTCKGSGIIVIDNMTGKLIVNDDDVPLKQLPQF